MGKYRLLFKTCGILEKTVRKNLLFGISTMAQTTGTANAVQQEQIKPQFYRRELPETCISFSSREGKTLFQEALRYGHMECYFKLAAQFRTQDEPAFCGLSTLVMILNALEIDPEKVWKGPWRWYHENMLDCCIPVKVIEQEGITFGQFICLAECNGLETSSVVVDENESEDTFRKMLTDYTKQDDILMTLSYSRKVLNQTGDGHFSPVGGYHPERDLVLILDTARFKYPPHWVPVSLLFKAMQAKDKSTDKPRGYVIMSKHPKSQILVLFRISESFGVTLKNYCSESIGIFLESWQLWLRKTAPGNGDFEDIAGNAVRWLLGNSKDVSPEQHIFTTQLDIQCPHDVSDQHVCAINTLLEELEASEVFKIVCDLLRIEKALEHSGKPFGVQAGTAICGIQSTAASMCCGGQSLALMHFMTLFLLCWPYQTMSEIIHGTNGFILNKTVCSIISGDTKYLGSELRLLRKQFTVLMSSKTRCCGSKICSKTC